MKHYVIALAALLAAGCAKEPPPDPGKPESYAVRLAVTPAPGAPEQRLVLPPAALIALRSGKLADLRLFDATERALPLALLGRGQAHTAQAVQTVPTYPVIGTATGSTQGVALTIGSDNVARVVGIVATAEGERPVAALLDTRNLQNPALAVTLDAELPLQQPVTFALESSADLQTWEPLGEKVLFRTGADGAQLGSGRIALPAVVLHDRYLRVSWGKAKGVAVRGASVTTTKAGAPARIAVATSPPQVLDVHDLRLALPFAAPIAAIRVDPAGDEGVLPVQLYGRDDPQASWTALAAATLRRADVTGNLIELGGATRREYRIVADARTAGFAAPPRVELLFDPIEMLAQFNAKPPFTLAAGLAGAPKVLLAGEDIAPGAEYRSLPLARVKGGPTPIVSLVAAEPQGWLSGKQATLWLILLAGVAVLGFAVVRLMRGSAR